MLITNKRELTRNVKSFRESVWMKIFRRVEREECEKNVFIPTTCFDKGNRIFMSEHRLYIIVSYLQRI